MTLSLHELTARLSTGAIDLDVKTATVTLDETWSPYVQATLVVTAPDRETLAALDPRTGARVIVTGTIRYGDSAPVSTLSKQWAGKTLAGLTTAYAGQGLTEISTPLFTPWNVIVRGRPLSELSRKYPKRTLAAVSAGNAGKTLSAISAAYAGSYNGFGLIVGQSRSFNLMLRSRSIDYSSGELTLTLASDEALLQDVALVAKASYIPATTSVRALVGLALGYCGIATLVAGGSDGTVDAGGQEWTPGTTAWSYVSAMVQRAGLRLWCDENRRFHLDPGTVNGTDVPVVLATGQNVTAARDAISLDDDSWYDAVVIIYRWTDQAGNSKQAVDLASLYDGFRKVLTIEHADTVYPGAGAAQWVLARAAGRGRAPAVTAVTNLALTTGDPITTATPDGVVQSGYASSVVFAWPDNEMTVAARDMVVSA